MLMQERNLSRAAERHRTEPARREQRLSRLRGQWEQPLFRRTARAGTHRGRPGPARAGAAGPVPAAIRPGPAGASTRTPNGAFRLSVNDDGQMRLLPP